MIRTTFALGIAVGDEPPTEALILRAGVNETAKGPVIFDDEAAKSVMAAFARDGVDLPIDLEHEMLDPATRRARRDACNALGWFGLEVRNGDLWMTNIRWNEEGRDRLLTRKQRYFSPAIMHPEDSDRALQIVNVALTALPATYDAQPLIAANRMHTPVNARTRALARELLRKRT